MGFNIYIRADEARDIEWSFVAEDHEHYLKWKERLEEALFEVSDMFIHPKPFLLYIVDVPLMQFNGQLSEGVFRQDPYQVDLESECLLMNTEFWEHCGADLSVCEMLLTLGELMTNENIRIETLTKWQLSKGLHCFGVYSSI